MSKALRVLITGAARGIGMATAQVLASRGHAVVATDVFAHNESEGIQTHVLDVTSDEATRSWAVTQAKLDEFPLVFVAGEAIGGLHELTQADVNGLLKKKVFG